MNVDFDDGRWLATNHCNYVSVIPRHHCNLQKKKKKLHLLARLMKELNKHLARPKA